MTTLMQAAEHLDRLFDEAQILPSRASYQTSRRGHSPDVNVQFHRPGDGHALLGLFDEDQVAAPTYYPSDSSTVGFTTWDVVSGGFKICVFIEDSEEVA